MSKEELRTRVEAELLTGKEPKELSSRYDMPYVTIISWRNKLFNEKPAEDISVLTHQTKASLELIKETAKLEAPKVAGKIEAIIDGVQGLKELEPEFQIALTRAINIAQEFLDDKDSEGNSNLSIKEWQLITSTLANTYGTLFNKSGTVVNVAQTNVNAEAENLGFFKANIRAV